MRDTAVGGIRVRDALKHKGAWFRGRSRPCGGVPVDGGDRRGAGTVARVSCDDVEQTDHPIAELETQLTSRAFPAVGPVSRQLGSDRGRDAATQLFNRRYLPSSLNREMDAHRAAGESFGVILLRLDAMGEGASRRGIDLQGAVLQQLALIVNNPPGRATMFVMGWWKPFIWRSSGRRIAR